MVIVGGRRADGGEEMEELEVLEVVVEEGLSSNSPCSSAEDRVMPEALG